MESEWISDCGTAKILIGDCVKRMRELDDQSVHCCVTSPPYWGLRDYGHDGQIGLESTPEAYVARMVEVFREVRRVLRDDGTLWLNLGDSYASSQANGGQSNFSSSGLKRDGRSEASRVRTLTRNAKELGRIQPKRHIDSGLKPKDLVGIPWRVAFALQADGWWLRQDIIWHKPNPMPESVRDRCTKAHEYVFLLTKSERYFYDGEAIKEPNAGDLPYGDKRNFKMNDEQAQGRHGRNSMFAGGSRQEYIEKYYTNGRNRRSVWTVTTKPYSGAHFAVMPADLVEPCIKAGCPDQCCPVCGAGYERITAKERTATRPGTATKVTGDSMTDGNRDPQRHVTTTQTLGWQPACDCASTGTIPGTVLDPFGGSGTTVAVAIDLGRNGICCELNPEYVKLAIERITPQLAVNRWPLLYQTGGDQ
jgi:DNA modification methylase